MGTSLVASLLFGVVWGVLWGGLIAFMRTRGIGNTGSLSGFIFGILVGVATYFTTILLVGFAPTLVGGIAAAIISLLVENHFKSGS